jgi:photosystem II stability/assembly factor-like uncharacterized protein
MGMRHPASALNILVLLLLSLCAASAEAGVNWWTPVGPEGGWVTSLAVDPAIRTVYAGTPGGVFVSTNGGGTWERSRGLRGVAHLAVSSVPSSAVYATGEGNLYRSTDGGASWMLVLRRDLSGFGINALAVDPADSSTVFIGTLQHGIWKSSDGGLRWRQVFEDASCGGIHSLVISARSPSTVYAGCELEQTAPFFKSTNGGATWTAKGASLPDGGQFFHLALDPNRARVLYATAAMDAGGYPQWVTFKSTNDGATWTRLSVQGSLLEVSPSGALFIGNHRSRDGGRSWEALPSAVTPYLRVFDPADPSIVYGSFFSTGDFLTSGLYKSTDAGTAWSPASRGIFATLINELAIDSHSTLYAVVDGIGLLKGPDGGARWERADAGLPLHAVFAGGGMPVLAIDPVEPENLYLGGGKGLARSLDGGASWSFSPSEPCLEINGLVIDPENPNQLYASGKLSEGSCEAPGRTCPVFRSADAGTTWECAAPPVSSVERIVTDPTQPARIFAVNITRGAWVSEDRGDTWSKLKNPRRAKGYVELAVDPSDSRRLYLGALNGKVFKSTDRGATWTEASRGLPVLSGKLIRRIVVDPSRPQTVYAAGLFGVYISGNGGRTWFPLNGGLVDIAWTFFLDPQNPRKLYAGTYGNGVYVHERQ